MPIKKPKKQTKIKSTKNRKKHVETMFLTHKEKKYPFYYKPSNLTNLIENNKNKMYSQRGLYTIKFLESGYLKIGPLKAVMRIYKWFIKNSGAEDYFKIRLFCFPDFSLTSKPKDIRMGKGKGAFSEKVAVVKIGQVFARLKILKSKKWIPFLALFILKKISQKLPFKTHIIYNSW